VLLWRSPPPLRLLVVGQRQWPWPPPLLLLVVGQRLWDRFSCYINSTKQSKHPVCMQDALGVQATTANSDDVLHTLHFAHVQQLALTSVMTGFLNMAT